MKTAVVLFNLGGPDRLQSVGPFLFNLFSDPAIIGLPQPFRWLIAGWIALRRTRLAQAIYAKLGGGSPLLANTEAQAQVLEEMLGAGFKTFIAMRYWHPRAARAVREVVAWQPDQIILLPLYPQFSTTTTASSVSEWQAAARRAGLNQPTTTICCWPVETGFVETVAARIKAVLENRSGGGAPRLLFSAHGLPQRVIDGGDPYQWQVEQSVAAIVAALAMPSLDYRICYQSRVGPLQWLGPSIEAEIVQAGADGKPLVVVPVSFVSEHSETLVELDIDYRAVAEKHGVPRYDRVATVDAQAVFIEGLAQLVRQAIGGSATVQSGQGGRICPAGAVRCAFQTMRGT